MTSERDIVYLAALLHDIGKFWQRADPDGAQRSKILNQEIKDLESSLCPQYKGIYSHKHVLWTAQFFQENEVHLTQIAQAEKANITSDQLMRLSAAHHKPDVANWLQLLIQKADHYSSGTERDKLDSSGWKDAEEEDDRKWDAFRRIKMRSIFEGIDPDKADDADYLPNYKKKLGVQSIELSDSYFPSLGDDEIPDYGKLWGDFLNETKFIQAKSFKVFAETMLYLLEKYTTRIASSTVHLPDVSLYDHSKTVAAFSIAIYDYLRDKDTEKMPGLSEQPFVLIGGDLSGIQKFIYGIIAKGAAKNLKGRSFYLQLLIDSVVRTVLDEFRLFDANVIYASGGGFYILAPNLRDLPQRLQKIEERIAKLLFELHGTELYLVLSYVPFGEAELYYEPMFKNDYDTGRRKSINHVWKEVSEKLGVKKGQRFKAQIATDYATFFEPVDEGEGTERDAITGEPIRGKSIKIDDNRKVNEYTYQQIELGKKLKSAQYWIQSRRSLSYLKEEEFQILNLPYYNYFISKEKLRELDSYIRSVDECRVIFFNNQINGTNEKETGKLDFLETAQKGINNIYGFTFYGGNDFPVSKINDSSKTFEELCGVEFEDSKRELRKSAPDLVRLGILRMDVDGLGAIFQKGFAPSKRTFSRYSTLSRSLDYFFKGYLNQIRSSNSDFRNYSQIIYSGGDDLFIVGKWDVLIRMAVDINKAFRKWACNSPKFTLSGGVAIVGPKYPLLKAALLSERFEKEAKNHKLSLKVETEIVEINKNSLSIFGFDYAQDGKVKEAFFAFNWDVELEYLISLKNQIKYLMEKGLALGFSSEMFSLMQKANFQYNQKEYKFQLQYLPVIWQAAYNFKRDIQSGAKPELSQFLEDWTFNLFHHQIKGEPKLNLTLYHPLQLLALAGRWASMEKRSELKP